MKYYFIHIPKTAGMTIEKVFWDYLINKLSEKNIPCHVGLIAFNQDNTITYRETSE